MKGDKRMGGLISTGVYVVGTILFMGSFILIFYKSVMASLKAWRRLGIVSGAGLVFYALVVAYYAQSEGIFKGILAFVAVASIHIMLWVFGVFNTDKEG